MPVSKPKVPHVIRTVRIPATMDKALQKIAKGKSTSVNALVEASLTKLIEFDQFADELEFASVRKVMLVKGLDYLSDDQVVEFGIWTAKESGSELLKFYHGDDDLDSVIQIMESVFSKYGRMFTFHHEIEGRTHTIMMTHRLSRKWSILFDANLKTVFARIGIDLRSEVGSTYVRAQFEKA